jgi:Flp pilus assembly protein TadG
MKRYRQNNEKGAALLEAAITIPMILLITVGIFEFGRAYQTWQVLTNASREGARMAVLEGPTDADVRARVNSYLKGGGLAELSATNVLVVRNEALVGSSTGSRVELSYPFQFMMLNPVVRLIAPADTKTGAPITMKAATLMRNE